MKENLHVFCEKTTKLARTAPTWGMMYRMAIPNGIDCYNNQTLLICVAKIPFDWMGLNCYI